MESKSNQEEKVVVEEYSSGRLMRVREMTKEELAAERVLAAQRAAQTRARRKRIGRIIEESRIIDCDDFLRYVESGGDATADLRENLEKDRLEWANEVEKERVREACEIVKENDLICLSDYKCYVMSGGDATAVFRKYLNHDKLAPVLNIAIDRLRRGKIREIVEEHGFSKYEEYVDYVTNGGESTSGFRESLKDDKSYCIRELNLKKPTKKKIEKPDGKLDVGMTEMSRLILGLRKLGLGDRELADFLLWVESGDAKYEPGQLGGQQEEGQ